jgi:hypothetical protein
MARRELFISRSSAYLMAIKLGRRLGLSSQQIVSGSRAYPVYRRGECVGWEAWIPQSNGARPIREGEV